MHPPVAITDDGAIEVVTPDEIVIDDDVAAMPSGMPPPTAPAAPAAVPKRADGDAGGKPDHARGDGAAGAVVDRGIRIDRWTPDCIGIVYGHIDVVRVRRLNLDKVLTSLCRGCDGLLRRALQRAAGFRPLAHALDRRHHILLLR
jgi:hypothetical protein